jgi:mannose-6-phosphate isomerase-like protein (cupin superfamily)
MEIRALDRATPFTTADGSTIRSLLDRTTAPVQQQSLAEATIAAGSATTRHYHRIAEEFYFLLEGSGQMEIDGDRARIGAGDAVLIPAGSWHQITADHDAAIRMLCCCSPPYTHEDTFFV